MEPHIYIANHPETYRMILPLLHFLRKYPNTTVVCWSVAGLLLNHFTNTIPVDTKDYAERSEFRKKIEKMLVPPPFEKTTVVHRSVANVKQNLNLFFCPAGAPPHKGRERPWRSGIGRIMLRLDTEGIPFQTSFVYFHSAFLPPSVVPYKEGIDSTDPHIVSALVRNAYESHTPSITSATSRSTFHQRT